MRKAIYAGSFDPPTYGHLWMIEEAAKLFDEVIVAIGINAAKKTMFTIDERKKMLRDMIKDRELNSGHYNDRITVDAFEGMYLIKYAGMSNASHLIRGIRNTSDFEYEQSMRHVNEDMCKSCITTIFLMPPKRLSDISSSLIKGLIGPMGWQSTINNYVPDCVYQKLIERFDKHRDVIKTPMTPEVIYPVVEEESKPKAKPEGDGSLSAIFERRQIKYMIGKPVYKDIYYKDEDGVSTLLIGKGDTITMETINDAKNHAVFLELSMNLAIDD